MIRDPFDCFCDCHRYPGMMHVVACCFDCPDCGKSMIRNPEAHKEVCPGKPVDKKLPE